MIEFLHNRIAPWLSDRDEAWLDALPEAHPNQLPHPSWITSASEKRQLVVDLLNARHSQTQPTGPEGIDGAVLSFRHKRVFLSRSERVVTVDRWPAFPPTRGLVFSLLLGVSCLGGSQLVRRNLTPEGRDFDRLLAELDVGEPEPAANDPAISKDPFDLARVCGRSDVEILGSSRKQQIADAPANEICLMIELAQAVQHLERVWIDLVA